MKPELLERAGMDERQINEALCAWLTVHCPKGRNYKLVNEAILPIRVSGSFYNNARVAFTQSLDMMKLITDAMTLEQFREFWGYLREADGPLRCVCSDAPTRAMAAILALGLPQVK